jgi:hypothetical protein
MAKRGTESRSKHQPSAEEVWVKNFLRYHGTDNVTRFVKATLNGVSLTRAVQAVLMGDMISAEKCDGPGCICVFRHEDDNVVDVEVFFEANVMNLEIRATSIVIKETGSEPNAA